MNERDLSTLLVQMGLERGLTVDRVADELAGMNLPSFVDAREFRQSVIDSVESQLRSQVDEQIRKLRQQFGGDPAAQTGRVNIPPPPPPHMVDETTKEPDHAEITPDSTLFEDEDLPRDATVVWETPRE